MKTKTNVYPYLTPRNSRVPRRDLTPESSGSGTKHAAARSAKMHRFRRFLPAAAALLTAVLAHGQSYTLIDLGTLGGNASYAYGIGNSGRVVGEAQDTPISSHAALYSGSGSGNTNLGSLGGGGYSEAFAMNDSGQIVGVAPTPAGTWNATLFSGSGMANTNLGALGGSFSSATRINNSGQILGYFVVDGKAHGALFSGSGSGNINLSTLYGTNAAFADINDAGQLVGTVTNRTENGVLVDRATLFGAPGLPNTTLGTDYGSSAAYSINNSGQVVGFVKIHGVRRATLFGAPGSPSMVLGALKGGNESVAYSINNSGQIVGFSTAPGTGNAGFLYSGGIMSNLNDLVPANSALKELHLNGRPGGEFINDWGQIAAEGTSSTLWVHAALLNPIHPLTSTSNGGAARNTKFVGGIAYSELMATTNPSGLGTTVQLLGGTAGSAGEGTYGLNRDVNVRFSLGNPALIASDIVTLTGTDGDTFVLQLTYNESLAISLFGSEENLRLGWFDGGLWKLAVDGNTGGVPIFVNGAWNASYTLGYYGVDAESNTVWAVLNHNSDFAAAIPVPEPSASALLGLGAVGLAWMRRSRQKRR